MKPIVGPDGRPMHRRSRELIRPELSAALGAWQRNVADSMQAEHAESGSHEKFLRHPKAAIWIGRIDKAHTIHHGSVIHAEPVRVGENFDYVFRGAVGDLWEGEMVFLQGFPGTMAALTSTWWVTTGWGGLTPGPERQWERQGDSLIVRIPTLGAIGVVIW